MVENKLDTDYRVRIWSNEIHDYLGRKTHTLGSYYSLQNGMIDDDVDYGIRSTSAKDTHLEQFTQGFDINNQRVYERDIVQYEKDGEPPVLGYVRRESNGSFSVAELSDSTHVQEHNNFKVIGNINSIKDNELLSVDARNFWADEAKEDPLIQKPDFRVWGKEEKAYLDVQAIAIGRTGLVNGIYANYGDGKPYSDGFDVTEGNYSLFNSDRNKTFVLEPYTGIKDADGRKIYVGDIVQSKESKKRQLLNPRTAKQMSEMIDDGILTRNSLKVIGNKHQNPMFVPKRQMIKSMLHQNQSMNR